MAFGHRRVEPQNEEKIYKDPEPTREEKVFNAGGDNLAVMDYADMENEVEATKITSTMEVHGDIRSKDSIYSSGKIFGNVITNQVFSSRDLTVGNVDAEIISLNAGRVKGNLKAQDKINVAQNSVVVGNVKCDDVLVSGKIKGDIDVKNSAFASSTSLIVGDVIADSISTEQGARLNGRLTMRRDSRKSTDFDAEFDLGGDF